MPREATWPGLHHRLTLQPSLGTSQSLRNTAFEWPCPSLSSHWPHTQPGRWRPRQGKCLAPEHSHSINWWHLQATNPPWLSRCHVLPKSLFLKQNLIFSLNNWKQNRVFLLYQVLSGKGGLASMQLVSVVSTAREGLNGRALHLRPHMGNCLPLPKRI